MQAIFDFSKENYNILLLILWGIYYLYVAMILSLVAYNLGRISWYRKEILRRCNIEVTQTHHISTYLYREKIYFVQLWWTWRPFHWLVFPKADLVPV